MSIRSSYVPEGLVKDQAERRGPFNEFIPVPFIPEARRTETADAKHSSVEITVGFTKMRILKYSGKTDEDFLRMLSLHSSYIHGAKYVE